MILTQIRQLLDLFEPHCADSATIHELRRLIEDRGSWKKAHALFQKVRRKTLRVDHQANPASEAQYLFEEVCTKTLYNLSHEPAPFDADSPYWIVPNALVFARLLQIDTAQVVAIICNDRLGGRR
jgi:hypothetical protein